MRCSWLVSRCCAASIVVAAGCGPSSDAGVADASESGESDSGVGDFECANPVTIMQFDGVTPSGFVECDDGFVHRSESLTCLVPPAPQTCEPGGGFGTDTCTSSADCTEHPHGACLEDSDLFAGCNCVYGCETDADCDAGSVCACTGGVADWPRCVPADCGVDADCDGGACGLSRAVTSCGGDVYDLACWHADSDCRASASCGDHSCTELDSVQCVAVSGEWTCGDIYCTPCG